jgi:hypothetical protein
MSFWDAVWLVIISFAFVAYLMIMFSIITDLFRDQHTSSVVKAVWLVLLFVLPFLTAVLYVVTRGGGMAERATKAKAKADMVAEQEAYIRDVAGGTTPGAQIAQAKTMLDAGTISRAEFEMLKQQALGKTGAMV